MIWGTFGSLMGALVVPRGGLGSPDVPKLRFPCNRRKFAPLKEGLADLGYRYGKKGGWAQSTMAV